MIIAQFFLVVSWYTYIESCDEGLGYDIASLYVQDICDPLCENQPYARGA